MLAWHILTGEFPPQPGGVSDYTDQLARALASTGREVHVWAPAAGDADSRVELGPGLTVHRLRDGFTVRGIRALRRQLDALPGPQRLLVQYVPTAFGYRGMNLPLCAWLLSRRHADVWVMFHEVAFPFGVRRRTDVLAAVNSLMASVLLTRADAVLTSTSAWTKRLQRLAPVQKRIQVAPVPSNLPTEVEPRAVSEARESLLAADTSLLVGHFGTYGALIRARVVQVVPAILEQRRDATFVLLGRGNQACAAGLRDAYPDIAVRIVAPHVSEREPLAAHLAACDVIVQPFPDGVTTRRTSVMASLALGRPTVSNHGPLTEPDWDIRALALAPTDSPADLVAEISKLLSAPEHRATLGRNAAAIYRAHFSLERLVGVLTREDPSLPNL